jgi:predicted nucleotidyltransferase
MYLIELYTTLIGSHAYGLNTPESDIDLRGIVVPNDLTYHFGTRVFEQHNYPEDDDHVAWHLKKFMPLAAKGNTQMLEMIFSPEDCQRFVHPVFQHFILDEKKKFMTQAIFPSIFGYAYSEHQKALGLSSRDLGARRKEDLGKYGYSSRNASHCIRLMYAGAYAMDNGEFPVRLPEPEREICLDIKQGKMPLEGYEEVYQQYLAKLETAGKNTSLPPIFDYDWMNAALVDIQMSVLNLVAVNQPN